MMLAVLQRGVKRSFGSKQKKNKSKLVSNSHVIVWKSQQKLLLEKKQYCENEANKSWLLEK